MNPWKCNRFLQRAFMTVGEHIDLGDKSEYAISYDDVHAIMQKFSACQGVLVIQDLMGNRTIVDDVQFQTINLRRVPTAIFTTKKNYPILSGTFVEVLCFPSQGGSSSRFSGASSSDCFNNCMSNCLGNIISTDCSNWCTRVCGPPNTTAVRRPTHPCDDGDC